MYNVNDKNELAVLVSQVVYEDSISMRDLETIADRIQQRTKKEVTADMVKESMSFDILEMEDMRRIAEANNLVY